MGVLSRGRVARGNLTILVILALPGKDVTPPDGNSMLLLCAFVFGAVVFAAVWSRFLRRGPLEYLLHSATKLSKLARRGSAHTVTGGRIATLLQVVKKLSTLRYV